MRSAPTWSEARSPLSLLGFLPLFLGYTLNTMNLVNGLNFNTIRGDIYGGLTAAVVALPLAMAMGVASGVGPVAGMYGAIFVGFFAALFRRDSRPGLRSDRTHDSGHGRLFLFSTRDCFRTTPPMEQHSLLPLLFLAGSSRLVLGSCVLADSLNWYPTRLFRVL